jgi:hypothetical protein
MSFKAGKAETSKRRLTAREVGGRQGGIGRAFILQMRRLVAIRDSSLILFPGNLALGQRLVVEAAVCL